MRKIIYGIFALAGAAFTIVNSEPISSNASYATSDMEGKIATTSSKTLVFSDVLKQNEEYLIAHYSHSSHSSHSSHRNHYSSRY